MKSLNKNSAIKVIGKAKTPKSKPPTGKQAQKAHTNQKNPSNMKKSRQNARAGEVWVVNNKIVRGHPSLLTRRKHNNIEYIVTTHAPYTAHKRNIKLQKNFDKNDIKDSYIVKKLQRGYIDDLGTYKPNLYPRNNIDKSIIRAIKNKKK